MKKSERFTSLTLRKEKKFTHFEHSFPSGCWPSIRNGENMAKNAYYTEQLLRSYFKISSRWVFFRQENVTV